LIDFFLFLLFAVLLSQHSDQTTFWTTEESWFNAQQGQGIIIIIIIIFSKAPRHAPETAQPYINWEPGKGSSDLKRPERGGSHSSSGEANFAWSCTPVLPCSFRV